MVAQLFAQSQTSFVSYTSIVFRLILGTLVGSEAKRSENSVASFSKCTEILSPKPRFSLRLRSPTLLVLRELIIFDLRPLIDDYLFFPHVHQNYKGCQIYLKCCITRPPFSFESSQKTAPTSPLPP